jgi:hypothetical protein
LRAIGAIVGKQHHAPRAKLGNALPRDFRAR